MQMPVAGTQVARPASWLLPEGFCRPIIELWGGQAALPALSVATHHGGYGCCIDILQLHVRQHVVKGGRATVPALQTLRLKAGD